MIRDLSESLRAMLDEPGLAASYPELAAAQIAFERPSEQYTPSSPTINLFLFDIRENTELRSNEPLVERRNGEALIHRPPMRLACSYLVTAWPVGGAELALQEHRLLSQVVQVLVRYPTIPAKFLRGSLVGQQPSLPLIKAKSDGIKDPSEFWTAIGNKLRPSITVVVTIALPVAEPETMGVALAHELRFGERTATDESKLKTATSEEVFHVGGRVTDGAGASVAGAGLLVVESGLAAVTDADGHFILGALPAGAYTLRAQAGAHAGQRIINVPAHVGDNYDVTLTV